MNVRQKLQGCFLAVAALVAAMVGFVLHADAQSTRKAAISEAEQVARGVAKDIAYGLTARMAPLYDQPEMLAAYIARLHELQARDIVVIDTGRRILADAWPSNVGGVYDGDPGGEIALTIADHRARVFTETGRVRQVVVPIIDDEDVTLGAVVLEYTPLYEQMKAATAYTEQLIVVAGALCIGLILVLGILTGESIARRIQRLTRAVERIRDGDYVQRVAVGRRDEISRLSGAFNDMAERLERSAREILAKEYTDSILAGAGEGICGLDAGDRIAFANEAAGRITGLGVDGLLRKDAYTLFPRQDGEATLGRPDGTSVRVAYTVSPIAKGGGAVIVLRDVSRQRSLEHDLRHQALHDALTGLPNRKLFHDRLELALNKDDVAVLYLDLDGFKRVNDSLGHNAGDLLLRTAAERLTAVLRPADILARLGGDEFAVLLENADQDTAERLAAACVATLGNPLLLHGREATVSVSVGVVPDAGRYAGADEVLRNADVAMYAAKAEGKACYRVFEARMHEQLLDRIDSEARLRDAVHRGELRVDLQPVMELPERRLIGVEALVRWNDPERGLQPPGSFIPMAEETGMVTEIDRWMLGEACRLVAQWRDTAPETAPGWVSVNLSAADLEVADLTDRVAHALSSTGLPPHRLVLELTETVLMRNVAVTVGRLEELRELGVRIAIDDFGTGYSSLGYLRDIPVDVLKMDRSFITGLVGNDRQQELVSAILQLGHTLGLRVVAEGVETGEQLDLLVAMRCRYAQGYFLGVPAPASQLIDSVRTPQSSVPGR
ncbi:EAL domain-containing protein [Paractinoplanes atraurantiacus]|uniref:Diguanylate cyclase (GGDEF) domain-containing protein n=1 Tax=Paractinoplanes atraurantiacus TaxID=1036182 RepID=A0A285KR11_9ACTN|nr:EAL domain-containing protein [Actinoplanes atraurantiacus]SNY75094.1 diguanylate cyclase (GGDEF) domain-containing protein [Actinoplanes atraurantiacus]